ncbi:MAG: pyridoxal phosphate-dependent aminotransferase [bacterium]|nr:pyridoxal phosphate-dependent aminotransferase [bacterium]
MTLKLTERIQRIGASPTLALTAKAKAMRAEGIDVVGFGAGEPDFDTPDFIKEAAVQALREGKTKYTPVGGVPELKEAIIQKLKRDNGLDYSPEQILVSCGGKHALYNIAQALLESGDEVIIPAPYWVTYPDQVVLNDAHPVILSATEENGFKITPEQLEGAITPKTKAVIINSPSNPTGAAYSRSELEGLAQVIVKHQIACISDEIYEKIVYDGFESHSIASLNDDIKNLSLVVNGASKVYSMTGWRMGFIAGPQAILKAMTNLQSQVTSNINSITQWAVVAALNGPQDFLNKWVGEFKNRRDFILESLNSIPGILCFKPQGAFYVFPNISALLGRKAKGRSLGSDMDFCNYLLEEAKVACVPGSPFGAPGFMRLSYATSMENIEKGLERIREAVSNLA